MHWTYCDIAGDPDLQQGDILEPSARLRALLKDVHPYFCAEKYLGFVIATQSCDLVRRHGRPPKASHIAVGVIRSLRNLLPQLVSEVACPVAPGVFRASDRGRAKDLLHRILNQNEQALGLFYLHPESEIGLGEACVALLRVKVALRAEHYDLLVQSRRGRLAPEFRAKFGWLLGNLYARAASPDWSDFADGENEVKRLIRRYLDESAGELGPIWVDDEVVEAATKQGVVFADVDPDAIQSQLESYRPKPKIDQLVEAVSAQVSKVLQVEPEALTSLKNRLRNDRSVNRMLKG